MRKTITCLAIAALALAPATHAAADADGDRAAAAAIAQNMKESGQLKDYRVGVKFQDGVAWLMGSVTSPEQREIAERIANQTEGVGKVVNKLEISGQQQAEQTASADSTPAEQPIRRTSAQAMPQRRMAQRNPNANMPVPYARTMQGQVQPMQYCDPSMGGGMGGPGMGPGGPMGMPAGMAGSAAPMANAQTVSYDTPSMPGYAWPSYAAYPNYAALTYPQQYSPSAWPYIGPFYPYPQVPLGWRKVQLEWDDGWWQLDFSDCKDCH